MTIEPPEFCIYPGPRGGVCDRVEETHNEEDLGHQFTPPQGGGSDLWLPGETAHPSAAGQSSEEHFEARVDALLGELLDTDALDHIPALEPLIEDVLFLDTLARVYGASGTFKSFMTLDFAGCVGAGVPWHGRRVRQGLVLYIVAEGAKGVRKRVRAWEQYHGHKMTGVRFLPRPVQAMDPEWLVLIEVCRRLEPVLVIVDTQARVTVGVEENSNTEMGRVVDRMEQMRAASGACVLLVHHAGHDSDRGRGATAVKGALQTELGVERKGKGLHDSQVTLKTGKQKDDEELGDVTFVLHQVKLDGEAREDGSPVTSIVLVPLDPTGQAQAQTGHRGRVEQIAARLDAEGVPSHYGRDKLRAECMRLGIKAENSLLTDVAKHRKERASQANHLSANLSARGQGTRTAISDNSPVRHLRTVFEETAGETCPGQVADSSGQGRNLDLSAPLPSLRERTGRTADLDCAVCGEPMPYATPGETTHPTC